MTVSRPLWPLLVAGTLLGAGALAYFTLARQGAPVPAATPAVARPPLKLYAADAQGMYLVPQAASMADAPADPAAWADHVFARLAAPGTPQTVPAVPPGVTLRQAVWKSPHWALTVAVDRPLGSTGEKLLIGALVRTFLESWPGAKAVKLALVDAKGEPYESQHLDLSAPLTLADVANTAADGQGASGMRATLWWPAKGATSLVPVQVTLSGTYGVPPRDAFAQLAAGPPAESAAFLDPVVPAAYGARWAGLSDGLAVIEVAGDPPTGPAGIRFVEAAVLTLTEFPDVKAVAFVHEGKPIAAKLGAFDLRKAQPRPAGANAPSPARR